MAQAMNRRAPVPLAVGIDRRATTRRSFFFPDGLAQLFHRKKLQINFGGRMRRGVVHRSHRFSQIIRQTENQPAVLETWRSKTQQHSSMKSSRFKLIDELGVIGICELCDRLRLNNHSVETDEVRPV